MAKKNKEEKIALLESWIWNTSCNIQGALKAPKYKIFNWYLVKD